VGAIGTARKVKLFCGIIYSDESVKEKAFAELENKFGKIDFISKTINFEEFTSYYNAEMGSGLKRLWISFEPLICASDLAAIKIFTNHAEDLLAFEKKRRINVDPGYITAANVILASTKDFSHRIYIGQGIYAEVTTIYKKDGYVKLPWSYPDYMSPVSVDFLLNIRKVFMRRVKELCASAT
jgi:hypothetical protein